MRRAHHDFDFLIDEDSFLGINLGWDFCAEHEFGISRLRTHFPDNTNTIPSIEGYKLDFFDPDNWRFVSSSAKDKAVLLMSDYGFNYPQEDLKYQQMSQRLQELNIYAKKYVKGKPVYEENCLATGWSDRDLGIHVFGKRNVKYLMELWEAVKVCDVALWQMDNSSPFARNGLVLGIMSKVPDKFRKIMDEGIQELKKK